MRLKVDLIVTGGPPATHAAKKATNTIPIVMTLDNDPVGNGFVASLARPGGNITGLSTLDPEISGKRLELLKEIIPRLTRVAVFGNSTNPGNTQALKEMQLAAGALGVTASIPQTYEMPRILRRHTAPQSKERADAVLMLVRRRTHFSPKTDRQISR